DDFFGSGDVRADERDITQYTIKIDRSAVDNFKENVKLKRAQLVSELEESRNVVQSTESKIYVKDLYKSMLTFDWPQHQYFLNTFAQYRTEIEGLRVHFARIAYPDSYKRIYPILLIHSWPSTFWEFYKVIPILSNPDRFGFDFGVKTRFAFEVIVPSIPGLAFSDKPSKPGLGIVESARILGKLMEKLGFLSYFVHGHGYIGCNIGLHVGNPSMPNFLSTQFIFKQHLDNLLSYIFNFHSIAAVDFASMSHNDVEWQDC
ncbi:unnamed protein product, partial [Anisakis simplex]|uniref:Epoxide hydrolase 1 (inferred by orthology to a human protein) n=1 Tax=Anisakis simplex TaxID=6269 RepID=A0A0M3K0X9_ANISI